MEDRERELYDVVGIGFGPSNLSLAIALEEHYGTDKENSLSAAFFEKQASLGWHRNMLLPEAKMQISFLKDLATFRNPVSRFSFISYLHSAGRLAHFVNNQDFFPTRQEFHDYLEWAETRVSDRVRYNTEVRSLKVPEGGRGRLIDSVQIEVQDNVEGGTKLVDTRNVVISTGLVPKMPIGIERSDQVWHSSEFLERFRGWNHREKKRVAVVGAGQSAAEIVRFIYDTVPDAEIFVILSAYGYSIADDTPFANRIFDAAAVDDYYHGTDRSREAFWKHHRNTNYGVADDEVIRDLFRRVYQDEVRKTPRLNFVNLSRVDRVKQVGNDTRVTVNSLLTEDSYDLDVDVLICSTGYESMEPTELLGDLEQYCVRDEQGRFRVERDYRLVTTPELQCGIYLQGGTEHTHGLASSLLSNIAVRSGEIADSIADRRQAKLAG